MSALDIGKGHDGGETTVLGEGERDGIQGRRECAHGVLLNGGNLEESHSKRMLTRTSEQTYLVCGFRYCYCAADVGSASTIYDTIVHDEIADHTDGIMQGPLSLVNDLVTSTNLVGKSTNARN